MSSNSQLVKVGQRRVELFNLQKILFPDGISKARLIEYYLKVAPTLLTHTKGRPLSFVRLPDGVAGQAFYQKNKPDNTPQWFQHVALGSEEKLNYILASDEASLAWLANQACVEFHQMHCRAPHFDRPDYMVFDLDPPENYRFALLVELALQLREHIETLGYHAFVKTTGRKGLHIVVPIEPRWAFDHVFDAASAIARRFVASHRDSTLHLKKDVRSGKVLIDIYRNRPSQTIVSNRD
jgi:DNA ligase D-like protein (predicted polymerase)